ncbi:trans-sulfuration enzyme family protein [Bhargavaea beijingensis]|uniref:homocysteine desulfhydrase n=1 Tax=Bhargavaea beijingensis TaxID=426756 RepID=A0A1G7EH17_9BACL|nr:PLP-dependent transferase [Bhargavaea beijingensis]MCW1928532.1 PLP-dependent transferase [Bhargavaea beijingensis]RSK25360.1 methionine gamma-lyase [Bhargavaea beijingensis]SDE62942.1 methionine-gamma-lyase [Bhargavaea beijingensis]
MRKKVHRDTLIIHEGHDPHDHQDSLAVPLYQTSTYVFPDAASGAARFAGEEAGNIYSRLTNPTVRVLEERIAALEKGAGALVFGSGMAAVSAVLVHATKAGDHVLCTRGIYGCTFGLLNILEEKYGITHGLIPMRTEEEIERHVTPETSVIYIETPVNPTMEVADIRAAVSVARRHGLKVIVDNTFCSPYIQNPLDFGADFVLHSATKYINGHGDVIAGLLVGADEEEIGRIRMTVQKDFGGIVSPFDAWLMIRGLKTLAVRMERHCSNAEAVLNYLKTVPAVREVHYPFDDNHPDAEVAKRQMTAGGGIFSFTLDGGLEEARIFLDELRLVKLAVSLGDAESLIQHPATMTHSAVPGDERKAMGITDSMIRFSAGLEHPDDIIADLDAAFAVLKKRTAAAGAE